MFGPFCDLIIRVNYSCGCSVVDSLFVVAPDVCGGLCLVIVL